MGLTSLSAFIIPGSGKNSNILSVILRAETMIGYLCVTNFTRNFLFTLFTHKKDAKRHPTSCLSAISQKQQEQKYHRYYELGDLLVKVELWDRGLR